MAEASPKPKVPPIGPCLNCGREIDTNYCPDCGQHNTSHNHGIWQFIQEFLEEFIRFDSKLVRTLVPLVTKPGFLTQEWVVGRRVRYITPLKLYVTLSALCFLAFPMASQMYRKSNDLGIHYTTTATPTVVPKRKRQSAISDLMTRKMVNLTTADRERINEIFLSRLPTMNFILMPVAAFIFKVLYVRRSRFYVEHLVFTLHVFSFAFLVIAVSTLVPFPPLQFAVFLWLLGYLPFAMKRNYGQGWLKTLFKCWTFGTIYSVVLIVAIVATLLLTALSLPDKPTTATQTSAAIAPNPGPK